VNGALDNILSVFYHQQYATTRTAIVNKYGEPTRTRTESWRNGFGAVLQGEVAIWDRSGSVIVLGAVQLGESSFYIFNPVTELANRAVGQTNANARF
jgi:hypothetical protein